MCLLPFGCLTLDPHISLLSLCARLSLSLVPSVLYSQPHIMPRIAAMLICKLPVHQLCRLCHKFNIDLDKLPDIIAVRMRALHFQWCPKSEAERVCFAPGCGKCGLKFKRCAGCQLAEYCSEECQRNDWRAHKPMCLHWRNTAQRHDDIHGNADP